MKCHLQYLILLALLSSCVTNKGVDTGTKFDVYTNTKNVNVAYNQVIPYEQTTYVATSRKTIPTQYDGYKLVWNDEFDIDGLPRKAWSAEQGFVRNNELQWYQMANTKVDRGCLVIEGRKEKIINPNYQADNEDWRRNREYAEYTSTSLSTRNSFVFKYGRLEVRAKIPVISGSWPAIWLLGNKWDWPQCGEIDVMEFYISNGRPSILANACWGSDQRWKAVWNTKIIPFTHFLSKDSDWANQFHLWRMDWDSKFIRIYLDGELLNEIDLSQTQNRGYGGNAENPFSNDVNDFGAYILLNLAIGGNGGTPDDSRFPLRYFVDYVRVYQPIEVKD